MRLVLLGNGTHWKVYALCGKEKETCEVLQLLETLEEKRATKMLSDLQQFVPNSTRADWVQMDFSWKLRGTDKILEFRWPTRRGGTPRVYWFYDENRVVVCSHGVDKKGDTDQQDIDQAEAARAAYLKAKAIDAIEIVSLEQFELEQTKNETPPHEER